ncbi:neurotrophin-3 isoform X1 [Osmerus mordax]|uniref:neurotrophin-3 isoform X1 n=2 Tax=Osmerus mordax TaxID=8014 RepID=UPI00350E927A
MLNTVYILQVNLVMSILLSVMFLAYLYGIQATNMDRQQSTQDPLNSLIIKLLQADLTRDRPRQGQDQGQWDNHGEGRDNEPQDKLPPLGLPGPNSPLDNPISPDRWSSSSVSQPLTSLSSELLTQHKRYNSPRVLLSDRLPLQPPPLYLIDDYTGSSDGANNTGVRKKRYAEHKSYRGEYSVCDSESQWVTDKTNAVDIRGRHVTVLGQIKTSATAEVKQYFYETKCRTAKPYRSGCRGIDDKHWNSQCKTSQTYVRALTQERSTVGWRWIRIDTSCVCALSRKHRRT